MSSTTAFRWYHVTCSFILLMASFCIAVEPIKRDTKTPPSWGICTPVKNAEKMKAAGYHYIEENVKRFLNPLETDKVFEERLAGVKNAPLKIYSYNNFLTGKFKSTGPETHHDEILEYAETAFRRAELVGSQIIVFGSSGSRRLPKGFPYDKGVEQFIELLKRMGPIASQYGITVVIEPLNKDECNFINSVKEATDIAKAVGHPNIAVLADVYHMAKEDEGPESIIYAGKLLKHCHVAELKDRKTPGTNNFDFTPYFSALKEIKYQGRVSIEAGWDDFEKQLPEAIAYMNSQWAKAE